MTMTPRPPPEIKTITRKDSQYTFLQWRCQAAKSDDAKCHTEAAYEIKGDGGHAMLCTRHYANFCKSGKARIYA
jgi:hypothetical protein